MPIYEPTKVEPEVQLEEGQSLHKGIGAEGVALCGLSKKPPIPFPPGTQALHSRSLSHHPGLNGSREISQLGGCLGLRAKGWKKRSLFLTPALDSKQAGSGDGGGQVAGR